MIEEIVAHHSILSIPGIGPKKAKKILDSLSSYDSDHIFTAVIRIANSVKLDAMSWQSILSDSKEKSLRALDTGISIIPYLSDLYPSQLKELDSPPINLYIDGSTDAIMGDKNIAIIGTRNPGKETESLAPSLCQYISQKATCIVSGLAIGCDTIAHNACLNSGTVTTAVLPCGIDQIYPKQNAELAREIKHSGGCLISEYEPGIKPQKSYFVARDRIQAGISHSIVLLQSTIDGGSMHAMRTMQTIRRPYSAISPPTGRADDYQWSGNAQLIQEKKCTIFDYYSDEASRKNIIDSFLNSNSLDEESHPFEQPSLF